MKFGDLFEYYSGMLNGRNGMIMSPNKKKISMKIAAGYFYLVISEIFT